MQIAYKTLAAVEAAFQADQGARYRGILRELMPLAEDAYNDKEEDFRNHLGASLIGSECDREIWYSWHWAIKPRFTGQELRLFNRGHLEEPRMLALMKMLGIEIWFQDANGKQFRIHGYRGHYGGGMDGVVRGIPELPNIAILGEFKTHNLKSFTALAGAPKTWRLHLEDPTKNPFLGQGVKTSKWSHYVQMQEYMAYNNLTHALYCAVCKDTDDVYMEVVEYDGFAHRRTEARVISIVDSPKPPVKINDSPAYFYCKHMCDYVGVCHKKEVPERNCRTCVHVSVADGGKWVCERFNEELSPLEQRAGCDFYLLLPSFNG